MPKYAAVYFGPDESKDQREFLSAMNGVQIITLSKEEIDNDIKEFERIKVGVMNRLVLHDEKEVTLFECCMKAFFSNKEYKITDDPDDEEFAKWLREKEQRI